ncbi:hypothetical protein K1T71_011730 [Dendrolimus kikuchii]|uniref:Uncharacterized protein n=1 Tax=Dendrolimus kikuchii TaxID=765133 RepID=A0ACC1CLZ4_9NEOP|nr:hypothetical protein K1T71_011730 [Dendrolimus kikuchii]
MAWTTAGSDRSGPMFAPRTRRSPSQAGHSCRVCNAVSSTLALQCWHPDDDSRPIRHRYRPKQPCPVSTCVWRILTHLTCFFDIRNSCYARSSVLKAPDIITITIIIINLIKSLYLT